MISFVVPYLKMIRYNETQLILQNVGRKSLKQKRPVHNLETRSRTPSFATKTRRHKWQSHVAKPSLRDIRQKNISNL